MCSISGNASTSLAGAASTSLGASLPTSVGGTPSLLTGTLRPRLQQRQTLGGAQSAVLTGNYPRAGAPAGAPGGGGGRAINPDVVQV